MTGLGEFSTHHRDGSMVTKRLTGNYPGGQAFVSAGRLGEQGMRSYLAALRAVGVRLPDDLDIVADDPLTVRHSWVPGPTLVEIADTDPPVFAAAVEEITAWVRGLDLVDARIDTNLANFCLVDSRPVLVDVLPPLVPSRRPRPVTLFDRLFCALCFDTAVTLDALCGYALRTALRTERREAVTAVHRVMESAATPAGPAHGFPARWFRGRLRLALRCASGEESSETMHEFFALTSVLTFRQLDEAARRQRLGQVAVRMRELGL